MNASVLVTGAGGFIGSAVVRMLVRAIPAGEVSFADGAPIERVVAVLRPGGARDRLQEVPPGRLWAIEQTDLADQPALTELLERSRPRAIVHAALDRAAYEELAEEERSRRVVAPLEALFEGLSGVPGARMIHTGSAWVLQGGDALGESAPVRPRSAYARSKALEDAALPRLHGATGVPWINLRLFNTFGRYERATRLLPYLVSTLAQGKMAQLSAGDQIRDFNDVDVMARAFLLALQTDDGACGRVYHIGSGRGTRVRDFALAAARVTGNAEQIRFGAGETADQELACLVADPSLAQRVLGWAPADDLEARIRDVVQWWLDRGTTDPGPERARSSLSRSSR